MVNNVSFKQNSGRTISLDQKWYNQQTMIELWSNWNLVFILGDSNFEARNKTQVYKCELISRAYSELVALKYFWMAADRLANNRELKAVLDKLGVLYGLSCLDQHLIYFYEGGYARDKSLAKMVKDGVLQMCTTLKPDIIGVVDALAPPDFVVNSVLGNADGEVGLDFDITVRI